MESGHGLFTYVHCLGNHVVMHHRGGQFEVAVGDGAGWVGVRAQPRADLGAERHAPQEGNVMVPVWGKEDTSHTSARCIGGSDYHWGHGK